MISLTMCVLSKDEKEVAAVNPAAVFIYDFKNNKFRATDTEKLQIYGTI